MSFSYENLKKDLLVAISAALIVSLFAWMTAFHRIETVHAASLTSVSDTLSDSRPLFAANHTIVYTNATSTLATQTISYTFDPVASQFGALNLTFQDVTSTGMTIVSSCSAGSNRVTMATTTTAITLTVCASNTISPGVITLQTLNNKITNPTSTGSYIIRIGGTQANAADTRVAIEPGVNVTASVATTFTFTVAGLATSTTLANNATTTGGSTSSSLPFGTISPGGHNELGQQLTVTTNAANGFAVTVRDDQDMQSLTGAIIHLFSNGNATSSPSPWTAPTNVLGNNYTYGHIGVTSDAFTSSTGKFGINSPLYAGAFQSTTTLTIFSATGTADGVTHGVGEADVAYRIEIGTLQAAANDYTNNLIYVATPVF